MSQQFVGSLGHGSIPARAARHGRAALALLLALGGVVALGAVPAAASIWGGHNGVVRLSFAPPDSAGSDSLPAVAKVAPKPEGTLVDVYAVLDDVALIFYQGTQVRALGGFELKLEIDGAPGAIVAQDFPFSAFNWGQGPGACRVGVTNRGELPIRDGRATLAHWKVRFADPPRNVCFRLDPAGVPSCQGLTAAANSGAQVPDCPDSGAQALWVGSAVSNLEGVMFACKCVPAYLNWEGPVDLSVPAGKPTWEDTGLFTRE